MASCFCMGPQNGAPLCHCRMRAANDHWKNPMLTPNDTRPPEQTAEGVGLPIPDETEDTKDGYILSWYNRSSLIAYADARVADAVENFRMSIERELEALRKDAERYRWLREHFRFANGSMHEIWFDGSLEPNDSGVPADLDQTIDAAIAAERGVG